MKRFQYQEQLHRPSGIVTFLCIFIVTISMFITGISNLSKDTTARQKAALERAIKRNMAYCYAVEGTYPSSLEYLKTHYGLVYDEDLFYVDYRTSGANLLPDVTIIERDN